MNEELDTELYKAIDQLNPADLTDSDKDDLLSIFVNTKNHAIRHTIVLMFADIGYHNAIPHIIKKINEKEMYNRNATLVHALGELDILPYYPDLIKIICEQGFEARLWAYSIVKKLSRSISTEVRSMSLKILASYHQQQPEVDDADYKDSTLHFIEATQDLLEESAQQSGAEA